jgi:hypothetical protein
MNERIRTSWSIGRRDNLSLAMSPLSGVGTPTYIAGFIHNSPDETAFSRPQRIGGRRHAEVGILQKNAHDIAAFLYEALAWRLADHGDDAHRHPRDANGSPVTWMEKVSDDHYRK